MAFPSVGATADHFDVIEAKPALATPRTRHRNHPARQGQALPAHVPHPIVELVTKHVMNLDNRVMMLVVTFDASFAIPQGRPAHTSASQTLAASDQDVAALNPILRRSWQIPRTPQMPPTGHWHYGNVPPSASPPSISIAGCIRIAWRTNQRRSRSSKVQRKRPARGSSSAQQHPNLTHLLMHERSADSRGVWFSGVRARRRSSPHLSGLSYLGDWIGVWIGPRWRGCEH